MKEKLYTIPLMDAFKAEDECPFCFVERQLEQHAMDFVLGAGASYMEDDVRAETDKMGFCRTHYKKMYDYGNRLGTGLILKPIFSTKQKSFMNRSGFSLLPGLPFFPDLRKETQIQMHRRLLLAYG